MGSIQEPSSVRHASPRHDSLFSTQGHITFYSSIVIKLVERYDLFNHDGPLIEMADGTNSSSEAQHLNLASLVLLVIIIMITTKYGYTSS